MTPDNENSEPLESQRQKIRKTLTVEEKLKILHSLRGITKGGPSMADELIKERRSDKW